MEENNSAINGNKQNDNGSNWQKDGNESKTHKNKGTGMSSEGGSNQTEESWQGINGGTMSDAQRKSQNQGNNELSENNKQTVPDKNK